MKASPQRIYLIGAGKIADAHAGVCAQIAEAIELHAADPEEGAREVFKSKHPKAILHSTSDEMLCTESRPDDIVVVATPPALHHAETLRALRSGRHVLCEKPFAMDMEQAAEMVAEAERLGLKIGCCSRRPFAWPLNEKARAVVQEGSLGRIYLVDWIDRAERGRRGLDGFSKGVWWSLDKSKAGGGLLMDLTPYDVSIWMKVFDPSRITILKAVIERIHVPADIPDGVTNDVESHVSATIEFQLRDGATFIMRFERSDSNHGPEFHQHFIHGLDGGLTWDLMGYGDRTMRHYTSKANGEPHCTQIEEPVQPIPESYLLHPLPQFALHVAGKASSALTGTNALNHFSIIQALYRCAEANEPVTIQL